ncbi:MAG: hypothetical protein H0V22_00775 [Solirubrobacterales bacterium]|nr:hypothetical protein [Solirubrobacterales bacterium]
MRLALVALIAMTVLLAVASPHVAMAGVLVERGDEVDLAQTLADAQEAQGVCYGWDIAVNGVPGDRGSSLDGPGVPLAIERCPKGYAILRAEVSYVCDSCEGEDSAGVTVDSNLPKPPTTRDLERLGFSAADLVGDKDDQAVIDMTGALPLLVAEKGNAPFVAYEAAKDVPAQDKPTNTPGSDLLRDRAPVLILCVLLLLAGPAYLLYKRSQRIPTH